MLATSFCELDSCFPNRSSTNRQRRNCGLRASLARKSQISLVVIMLIVATANWVTLLYFDILALSSLSSNPPLDIDRQMTVILLTATWFTQFNVHTLKPLYVKKLADMLPLVYHERLYRGLESMGTLASSPTRALDTGCSVHQHHT